MIYFTAHTFKCVATVEGRCLEYLVCITLYTVWKWKLSEWAEWVEFLWGFKKFFFKQILKVSAFYLKKQKSFIPKKNFFKPLSISKQKSFVYRPNFQWRFWEKGVEVVNTSETGQCLVDRELITGDSPDAADNLGKLAAPLLVKYAIDNDK